MEWGPKQRGEISVKHSKKRINKEFKNHATCVKRGAAVLFIISIYLSVRWSDYPLVLNGKLMELLFVHSGIVDSAVLNLVTGYFTGYLVYIFTVVIPTWQRQKVVRKYACRKLISLYNDSIFLLLLMAKSASTEKEWENIISNQKDLECFGNEFYKVMGKFDIQAPAETLLKLKDNVNIPIPWYNYLEYRYERIYNELDDIFLKYHMYLDEELLKAITEWKLGAYFDMFLGKGNNSELFYTGDDGIEYKENIPVTLYCQQKDIRVAPIFGKNEYVDNADRIRDYVENLGIIYEYCKRSVQGNLVKEDYTLNTFKKHNIGHIGTSRM